MKTTYITTILGYGNHATIAIPDDQLTAIGGSKRAPVKVTINEHTYQATATTVDGQCMVVFPTRDREAARVRAGDTVSVTLELDGGYRHVELPTELTTALEESGLIKRFAQLGYGQRHQAVLKVFDAKTAETKARRIGHIIKELNNKAIK